MTIPSYVRTKLNTARNLARGNFSNTFIFHTIVEVLKDMSLGIEPFAKEDAEGIALESPDLYDCSFSGGQNCEEACFASQE